MKRLVSYAVLVIVFSAYGTAGAANWVLLGRSNIGAVLYDRGDIRKIAEGMISVPVKYVYSSEGEKEFRDAFKNVKTSEKIGHTVYLYEIKCSSDSFRILKAASYTPGGQVIKGTELDFVKTGQASTQHITPNSMVDKLAGIACGWAEFKR